MLISPTARLGRRRKDSWVLGAVKPPRTDGSVRVEASVPALARPEPCEPGLHLLERPQAVLELVGHRLGLGKPLLFKQREAVLPQARLREAGELARQLLRRRA